jgi:regulator of sigma E protease
MTAIASKGLYVVLVLGLLIFFHELGHFLVAKLFRMGIRSFSLGFGPKLLGLTLGRTEYRLSALPLGGYVQLVAQEAEDESTEGFPPETWFVRRPAWQRMLVVAAGPVFNLVLAWALYAGLFYHHGRFETPAVVGQVSEGGAANAAGLKEGDAIEAVDGRRILYFRELQAEVENSAGHAMVLTVGRDGETLTVSVTPQILQQKNIFGENLPKPLLGIRSTSQSINIPLGPGQSVVEGLTQTWEVVSLTGQVFYKLVTGVVPVSTLGGPIMIAELVGKQSEQGLTPLATLTAMISINLAILNLLPIPVLDGGHILFFGLETVLRRPVPERIRNLTTKIGFALLMAMLALATANDIIRLVTAGGLQ